MHIFLKVYIYTSRHTSACTYTYVVVNILYSYMIEVFFQHMLYDSVIINIELQKNYALKYRLLAC